MRKLSLYYDYLEPICYGLAERVMKWVSQHEAPSTEANYLVRTAQRVIHYLEKTEIPEPEFDLNEIKPTLDYLNLVDRYLEDFLSGKVTGSQVIKEGGLQLWEDWNRRNGTQNFFNELVAGYVHPLIDDADVLEIGGGVGGTAILLADDLKRAKTFCFSDIKPYFLEGIKKKLPKDLPLHTQILDLHNLPDVDQQFDVIYATNAIHVANDIVAALRWIKSHLKESGTLVIGEGSPYSFEAPWPLEIMFAFFKGWWNVPTYDYRPNPGWLSPERWLTIFQKAGFKSMKIDLLMDEKRYFGAAYIAENC